MNWSAVPEWSTGPEQRSPQRNRGHESRFHVSTLKFYCWQGRRSTSGARSGGARVSPRDNVGAKAQLRRKRRRREDSCSAQMDVAHQGLFCACHSWTRFQPVSRQGKVWGTKYKSLLERTRLVACCWPWLSSGAKLKCNNAVRVWQRRRELKPECEEKHQGLHGSDGGFLFPCADNPIIW